MNVKNKIYNLVILKSKIKKEKTDMKDSDDLIYDLGLGSLSLVELIVDIECEFDIEIDEDDIEQIYKFGDLVNYVTEKVNFR
ncbi:acyl carrier protein [Anaerosacchariphilus polymeriproducens]|uniref:Acyl carrier protein n=1 Tax=Anaerosacchariphilus polymeriproducens TaxID=1812858 RepID=A0A371AS54_9FIRM|nr:acyl carrier protein [Anaerosacchariphilus polymeriproducens]RDU22385.1 acyl carrier protein [Anaerosacchariphilus polymeriproducens]